MFTPLKKILTYIQKNASGSPKNDNVNTINNVVVAAAEIEHENEIANMNDINLSKSVDIEQMKKITNMAAQSMIHDAPQTSAQSIGTHAKALKNRRSPIELSDDDDDDDDVESHITPNIIKQRNTALQRNHLETWPYRIEPCVEIIPLAGNIELDDELADFAIEPIVSLHCQDDDDDPDHDIDNLRHEETVEDVIINEISQHSDEEIGVNSEDEIITLEQIEVNVAFPNENEFEEQIVSLEDYGSTDTIILCEPELNTSSNNETGIEDPLALDDCSCLNISAVTNTSSNATQDADSNDEIMWLGIVGNTDEQAQQQQQEQQQPTGSKQRRLTEIGVPKKLPKSTLDVCDGAATNVNTANGQNKDEGAYELRSDGGSDSGLGSETSTLQTTLNGLADSSGIATPNPTPIKTRVKLEETATTSKVKTQTPTPTPAKQPLRSNLKRRLDDSVGDTLLNDLNANSSCTSGTQQKRPKRSINFDTVKVYYFPRQQGFNCVPTAGGCTLGMGTRHIAVKTLTLAEHAAELRRAHRMQMQDIQPHGSSSDDTEESEEDYLSDGSGSDPDGESNGFLQPVSPKQRRALLKAAGVRKIDASEKADCKNIRNSRETCGCTCREFCDPETCACSQDGIKCQVDRAMFPCGCTREACGNVVGRVEFNPNRVRTHYIHTIMRLDMEQRQQQNPTNINYALSSNPWNTPNNYYTIQPQSNYSSGYASPAYTPDTGNSIYQQQMNQPQHAQVEQTNYTALPELHASTTQCQLDGIMDTALYTGNANATPAYGEIMNTPPPPTYQHSLGYANYHTQPLHQQHNNSVSTSSNSGAFQNTNPPAATVLVSGFSSCAVPTAPPYGNATTTTATAQYQHANALETTANITQTAGSSYLAHATPASSTTAAAAATATNASNQYLNTQQLPDTRNVSQALMVLPATTTDISVLSYGSTCRPIAISDSSGSSLETPTIEDAQKNCLTFESLPAQLVNPTPIVAVMTQQQQQKPKTVATTPTMVITTPLTTTATTTESNKTTAAVSTAATPTTAAAAAATTTIVEI